jgi:hypothetical protein
VPDPKYLGLYLDTPERLRNWVQHAEAFDSLTHMESVLTARRDGKRPRRPPHLVRWRKEDQRPVETNDTDLWFFPPPEMSPIVEYVAWGHPLYRVQSRSTPWYRMGFLAADPTKAVVIPFHPQRNGDR